MNARVAQHALAVCDAQRRSIGHQSAFQFRHVSALTRTPNTSAIVDIGVYEPHVAGRTGEGEESDLDVLHFAVSS